MSDILWRLVDVTVPGRRGHRLDGVSLDILSGVTAVMGPSGAGKTTLLNLLVGFEKPAHGRVEWLADLTPGDSPGAQAKRLLVFWSPPGHGLWPQVSVRNHLASIVPSFRDATRTTDELLDCFDLTSLAAAYPGTLSQGERDRLSLARAIASGARVLVLDEPLIHVPRPAAERYWSQLRTACQEQKMSLVIATHDVQVAQREANHVIMLELGKVSLSGSVEELFRA